MMPDMCTPPYGKNLFGKTLDCLIDIQVILFGNKIDNYVLKSGFGYTQTTSTRTTVCQCRAKSAGQQCTKPPSKKLGDNPKYCHWHQNCVTVPTSHPTPTRPEELAHLNDMDLHFFCQRLIEI
jgi:hypothetical protein